MRFVRKKRLVIFLVIPIGLLVMLMGIPRTWSAMFPEHAPLGYYFRIPTLVALYTGLETLVDRRPPVPVDVQEIKNIEYKSVSGKSLQMDLYRPVKRKKSLPLIVFIHGGGWKSGDRADYLVYLTYFAQKGYETATLSYRLIGDAPYPACAEDVCDAISWLYTHGSEYGYDPNRIALVGGSAGAHLAMLAAYGWKGSRDSTDTGDTSPGIKALVEIYGPVDLTTEYARNHSTVTGLMGKPYSEIPDQYREASPITYVDQNTPPTLMIQGTSDELIPMSQVYQLKDKLDSEGVPYVFCPVPGWPHTMDAVSRVNAYVKKVMSDFFIQYLNE